MKTVICPLMKPVKFTVNQLLNAQKLLNESTLESLPEDIQNILQAFQTGNYTIE